jgi:hypothetical protein
LPDFRLVLLCLFDPEDGGGMFLRNVGFTFITVHDVISEKTVIFKRINGERENIKEMIYEYSET